MNECKEENCKKIVEQRDSKCHTKSADMEKTQKNMRREKEEINLQEKYQRCNKSKIRENKDQEKQKIERGLRYHKKISVQEQKQRRQRSKRAPQRGGNTTFINSGSGGKVLKTEDRIGGKPPPGEGLRGSQRPKQGFQE